MAERIETSKMQPTVLPRSSPRRRWRVLAGLLMFCLMALSVALGFQWGIRSPPVGGSAGAESKPVPPPAADVGAQADAPAVAPRGVNAPLAAEPLPAFDLPYGQQYPALLAQALNGDPEATCRLLPILERCASLAAGARFTEQEIERRMLSSDPEDRSFIERSAAQMERVADSLQVCQGVDLTGAPSSAALLELALPRLSPRQKTVLAMIRPNGELRRANPVPQSSQQWALEVFPQFLADRGLGFLHEGYAARDPLALEGLVLLYEPHGRGFQSHWFILPDPERFAVHALLLRDLFGTDVLGHRNEVALTNALAAIGGARAEVIHLQVAAEAEQWRAAAAIPGSRAERYARGWTGGEAEADLRECRDG